MKAFHLFDIAGIGHILCHYLNMNTDIVAAIATDHDPFNYTEFYGGELLPYNEVNIDLIKPFVEAADIVHVHSVAGIVPELAKLGKPIVLHYHGSELMERKYGPLHNYAEHFAAKVLVSNKYMLEVIKPTHKVEFLPNPIDTKHFKPNPDAIYTPNHFGGWLAFEMPYTDTHALGGFLQYSKIAGERITIAERNVSYKDMPRYLQMYDGYIDAKFHRVQGLLPALSTTGLQALAVGLNVMDHKGDIIREFPREHAPENVVGQLVRIYKEILE